MKDSNGTWWPLACSQNERLCLWQKTQESKLAAIYASHPCRQRGRCATVRVGWRGATTISALEPASSSKLWAGCQWLSKSSWDLGQFISARSATTWDQVPRGDTWNTWDCALLAHLGNWVAWTREVHKIQGPPETVRSKTPSCLNGLDLGRAKNTQSIWVCAFAEHLRTWAAYNWEVHETQGPLGAVPLQSTLEPEQCGHRKDTPPWTVANQCGPPTVSTPHTCQRCLSAGSLPLHSTVEQVSLNKWPLSPPRVRAEIRHWRVLQQSKPK